MEADFVRTAHSKGLPRPFVFARHVLRSAAVPLMTTIAVSLRFSLAVLPIVERIFAWRGAGFTVLEAIRTGDTALAITMILPFALVLVLVNILLETAYTLVDPRIRLGEGGAN
jgi:peptide/nickel transport system permease protein